MFPIKKFQVKTNLPIALKPLEEIAYNYWWCWDTEAWELFRRIDNRLFESVNHNPIQLLNLTSTGRLVHLAESAEFLAFMNRVHQNLNNYLSRKKWFNKQYSDLKGSIAYFSPEYGINESFPNYSGGLGILSGDHVKSASDLGLPMVAIGLLYQEGYFRQQILDNGWQTEKYNNNDFYNLPLKRLENEDGSPLVLKLEYPDSDLFYSVWELKAGNTRLFLMDTNIEQNKNENYRKITNRLYGGDRETRIQQEFLLGIGGSMALQHLGIECSCYHINEGHAAFALLERTKQFMHKHNLNFWEACQITKTSTVFTTHTPVPAGNEAFETALVEKYLATYTQSLGLTREEYLQFGSKNGFNPNEHFSMTVMGLRLSTYHNGVSKLHGEVSRGMWKDIWSNLPVSDIPIGHITNGIHTNTFVAPEFAKLFDRYLDSGWKNDTDNNMVWDKARQIPDEELWNEKQRLRMQLIRLVRERLSQTDKQHSELSRNDLNAVLNPEALTIGFARRFATYKRADLIFRDMDRLSAIINNSEKPVQILIAGKAHPHDTQGKETIQRIIKKVKDYGLAKSILFIEDYDMVIARALVRGCDVWLNNPIRPLEASGTSGMKSSLNGGLNLSVLDGWWDEGYNGKNGFAIGEGEESVDLDLLAELESNIIYDLLESRVTKLFYQRQSYGIPREWVSMMKEAIASIAPIFSTYRMVKDYSTLYYSNAMKAYHRMDSDPDKAKELYHWIKYIKENWEGLSFSDVDMSSLTESRIGETMTVNTELNLNGINPEWLRVEVYHGTIDVEGKIESPAISPMSLDSQNGDTHKFTTEITLSSSGLQGATIRVLPYHYLLNEPFQLYLCKWATKV